MNILPSLPPQKHVRHLELEIEDSRRMEFRYASTVRELRGMGHEKDAEAYEKRLDAQKETTAKLRTELLERNKVDIFPCNQ